jgi:hypothetical protein
MPKSSKKDNEQLAKLSPDCSFLLTRLIRKNDIVDYSEIKFIFCLKNEFEDFSQIQTNGQPVLFDFDVAR